MVILMRAVAEIEPEDIDAGIEQGADQLGLELDGPRVATIFALRRRRICVSLR